MKFRRIFPCKILSRERCITNARLALIATREDPQLPLARLRARSHLTELRAADLRFTASEASAFLSQVMGLSLSAQDIARLLALERGNFPLDDQRHWYRYHHLFADVLSAHLLAEQPDQVSALHRRASAWYEQHSSVADAIRHALSACDFGRAADLVELAMPAIRRNRQAATALGWL